MTMTMSMAMPTPMRIGTIANPRAGSGRISGWILRRLAGIGPMMVTEEPKDALAALAGLRAMGVEMLAVLGGDGTLHRVIEAARAVWGRPPPLFVLHSGTAGLVHRHLGAAPLRDAVAELEGLARGRRRLAASPVPTLEVGDRLAFNVGVGLPLRLARRAAGPVQTALLSAHLVASASMDGRFASRMLEPWQGMLQLDDEPASIVSASVVYASALDRLGPLRGWSRVEQPPDGFRVLQVAEGAPRRLLARVPWLALGAGPTAVHAARRVRMIGHEPFWYVADGESCPPVRELELRRGPPVWVARGCAWS
jgi:hypothetical protein